jgi:hypothetical protein
LAYKVQVTSFCKVLPVLKEITSYRIKKLLQMVKKRDGNFGNTKSFRSFASDLTLLLSEKQNSAEGARFVYAIWGKKYYHG